jgi:hypothetical protein
MQDDILDHQDQDDPRGLPEGLVPPLTVGSQ